ncbi:MAG: SMC-Scp complex subunit ScpB [Desulfobacterales bacterium]|jgi:segregation and condensation protein B|nr:SMC-Scp complex subunit ScpB [Desulfobacteraceae bacterium]MDY0313316.1 SMC-Scp complex subunit ScpB [Desulfobacterales bacterium]
MTPDLPAIIESLLFAAEEPLRMETLREVLDGVAPAAIRQALDHLGAEYEKRGGGFYLQQVAGGYQLRTRPCFHSWIRRLRGSGSERLSRPALETLAIVAYRQPILRAEIENLRGVDCGGVLRLLLERRLIRVMGRKEIPGRPLIYGTTRQFLEIFELRDLKDLPTLKEIRELVPDAASPEPSSAPEDGKNP